MAATYRVVVRAAAWRDVYKAAEYYENLDPDLALGFFDDFARTSRRLETFPFVGREPYPSVRRQMLTTFPYFVYYRVAGRIVRIVAVLHSHGNPDDIRSTVGVRL